jgi:hypothetical protein
MSGGGLNHDSTIKRSESSVQIQDNSSLQMTAKNMVRSQSLPNVTSQGNLQQSNLVSSQENQSNQKLIRNFSSEDIKPENVGKVAKMHNISESLSEIEIKPQNELSQDPVRLFSRTRSLGDINLQQGSSLEKTGSENNLLSHEDQNQNKNISQLNSKIVELLPMVDEINNKSLEQVEIEDSLEKNFDSQQITNTEKANLNKQKVSLSKLDNFEFIKNNPGALLELKLSGAITKKEFSDVNNVMISIDRLHGDKKKLVDRGLKKNALAIENYNQLIAGEFKNLKIAIKKIKPDIIKNKKQEKVDDLQSKINTCNQSLTTLKQEETVLNKRNQQLDNDISSLETSLQQKKQEFSDLFEQEPDSLPAPKDNSIKPSDSSSLPIINDSAPKDQTNLNPENDTKVENTSNDKKIENPKKPEDISHPPDIDQIHDETRQSLEMNYNIIPNSGGGNCLFKAFAQGREYLTNNNSDFQSTQLEHLTMRTDAVDYMVDNKNELNNYDIDDVVANVENDTRNTEYLSKMLLKNEWGGLPELDALASHFNQPVVVHIETADDSLTGGTMMEIIPKGHSADEYGDSEKMHIALSFPDSNQAHFELLVPKDKSDEIKPPSGNNKDYQIKIKNFPEFPDDLNDLNEISLSKSQDDLGVKSQLTITKKHTMAVNTSSEPKEKVLMTDFQQSLVNRFGEMKKENEVNPEDKDRKINRSTFTIETKISVGVGGGTDYAIPPIFGNPNINSVVMDGLQTGLSGYIGLTGSLKYKVDIEVNDISGQVDISFETSGKGGVEAKTKSQVLGVDFGGQFDTPSLQRFGVNTVSLGGTFDGSISGVHRNRVKFTFGSLKEAEDFMKKNGDGFNMADDHHDVKKDSNVYEHKTYSEDGRVLALKHSANRSTEASRDKWFPNMPRFNNQEVSVVSQDFESERRTNYNITTKNLMPIKTRVTSEVNAEVVHIDPRILLPSVKQHNEIGTSVVDIPLNDPNNPVNINNTEDFISKVNDQLVEKLDIQGGIDFANSTIKINNHEVQFSQELQDVNREAVKNWMRDKGILVEDKNTKEEYINSDVLNSEFPNGKLSLGFTIKHEENKGVTIKIEKAPEKVFDRANINISFDSEKILKNKNPEVLKKKLEKRMLSTLDKIHGFEIYTDKTKTQLTPLGQKAVNKLREGVDLWLKNSDLIRKDSFGRNEINAHMIKGTFGDLLSVGLTIEPKLDGTGKRIVNPKLESINKKELEAGPEFEFGFAFVGVRASLKVSGTLEKSHTIKKIGNDSENEDSVSQKNNSVSQAYNNDEHQNNLENSILDLKQQPDLEISVSKLENEISISN